MSPSVFILTPSLADNPRLHLREWRLSVNRYARTLLARFDPYGLLSEVADQTIWQALPANITVDVNGNPDFRVRPTYPAPPPPSSRETALLSAMFSKQPQRLAQLI